MSAIYDALKKTHHQFLAQKDYHHFPWLDFFLLMMILALIALTVFAYYPRFNHNAMALNSSHQHVVAVANHPSLYSPIKTESLLIKHTSTALAMPAQPSFKFVEPRHTA